MEADQGTPKEEDLRLLDEATSLEKKQKRAPRERLVG